MLRATKAEGDKRSQVLVPLRGRPGKKLYKLTKANMHGNVPSHHEAPRAIMFSDAGMNENICLQPSWPCYSPHLMPLQNVWC